MAHPDPASSTSVLLVLARSAAPHRTSSSRARASPNPRSPHRPMPTSSLSTSPSFIASQYLRGGSPIPIQSQEPRLDHQPIATAVAADLRLLAVRSDVRDEANGGDPPPPPPSDVREPAIGIEFELVETSLAFYAGYAERAGFRVRNSKSFTSRVNDLVIMRRFVCSKQGRLTKKDPFDLTKKHRDHASSPEGYKAMLQVNRRDSGRWSVSCCLLDHCHPLSASFTDKPKSRVRTWAWA